jgi:hypothetical protein
MACEPSPTEYGSTRPCQDTYTRRKCVHAFRDLSGAQEGVMGVCWSRSESMIRLRGVDQGNDRELVPQSYKKKAGVS